MIEIAPMITLNDFSDWEFNCKCGCGLNNMKPVFLWKLQHCRTEAKVRFVIRSGSRCEKHNRDEGGRDNSEHLYGEAADIFVLNSNIRFKILEAAFYVGFKRIGIGPTYIHLGNKSSHPQQVVWEYYKQQMEGRSK